MSNIEIFQSQDGSVQFSVTLEQETVWLSQAQMTQLFERDVSVISRHIRNIFKESELEEKSNLQNLINLSLFIRWTSLSR